LIVGIHSINFRLRGGFGRSRVRLGESIVIPESHDANHEGSTSSPGLALSVSGIATLCGVPAAVAPDAGPAMSL